MCIMAAAVGFKRGSSMESQIRDIYIGDRLPRLQAATACLNVGPKLRGAGRFCIVVGGFAVVVLLAQHVPPTSPILWAYLAVLGLGIYLYRPDPQPWALPAAGLVILAVLAADLYVDYEVWHRSHVAPHENGIGLIVEVLLAVNLFWNYLSYKRNLSATDADTLAEMRGLALATNKADLDQDTGIIELAHRNDRVRVRRLDRFVLLVTRHYIAFGKYSKLDAVAILRLEELSLAADGTPKAGRDIKFRLSGPGMKTQAMKLKPQYLSRVSGLGIATAGLPAMKHESGDATQETLSPED